MEKREGTTTYPFLPSFSKKRRGEIKGKVLYGCRVYGKEQLPRVATAKPHQMCNKPLCDQVAFAGMLTIKLELTSAFRLPSSILRNFEKKKRLVEPGFLYRVGSVAKCIDIHVLLYFRLYDTPDER